MPEELSKKNKNGAKNTYTISRREFLKDAGLVVGGATVGSMAIMNSCKESATETVSSTVTNTVTSTVTTIATQQGGNSVVTVTAPATTQYADTSNTAKNISLTVNGWEYQAEVKPTDTLRDLLHDKLGVISVKDMCLGYGACGSCSVIMNGRPILSCMMLAIECDGAAIETAEGITDAKHPLVDAYINDHCMQCGYCTPGFIVTAKALLDRNPKPSEDDIERR
jgi:aerobic-type carbon monoxide dehydrogenase small subunit (CoxS/CutS family)